MWIATYICENPDCYYEEERLLPRREADTSSEAKCPICSHNLQRFDVKDNHHRWRYADK